MSPGAPVCIVDGGAEMSESHDQQPLTPESDRNAGFFDWEVTVARERAGALRSTVNVDAATEAEASQAAYNELALSFQELNVAQVELQTLNDQVTESWDRVDQERRRYHELILAAPVPYIVTDRHGAIREVNHAASQLLRVSRERLHGKPLAVFVHDVSRRRLRRAILERSTSSGTSSVRFSISPRQAPPIFVEATLSSVADVDGAVHEIRWL